MSLARIVLLLLVLGPVITTADEFKESDWKQLERWLAGKVAASESDHEFGRDKLLQLVLVEKEAGKFFPHLVRAIKDLVEFEQSNEDCSNKIIRIVYAIHESRPESRNLAATHSKVSKILKPLMEEAAKRCEMKLELNLILDLRLSEERPKLIIETCGSLEPEENFNNMPYNPKKIVQYDSILKFIYAERGRTLNDARELMIPEVSNEQIFSILFKEPCEKITRGTESNLNRAVAFTHYIEGKSYEFLQRRSGQFHQYLSAIMFCNYVADIETREDKVSFLCELWNKGQELILVTEENWDQFNNWLSLDPLVRTLSPSELLKSGKLVNYPYIRTQSNCLMFILIQTLYNFVNDNRDCDESVMHAVHEIHRSRPPLANIDEARTRIDEILQNLMQMTARRCENYLDSLVVSSFMELEKSAGNHERAIIDACDDLLFDDLFYKSFNFRNVEQYESIMRSIYSAKKEEILTQTGLKGHTLAIYNKLFSSIFKETCDKIRAQIGLGIRYVEVIMWHKEKNLAFYTDGRDGIFHHSVKVSQFCKYIEVVDRLTWKQTYLRYIFEAEP